MTVVLRAETDADSLESVMAGLVRAWNEGEALSFASYFADDADLVNIHGMHLRGRQAIAGVYQMLFRSVFLDSSVTSEVRSIRMLRKNVALIHLKLVAMIQSAAMAGSHDIVSSVVMMRDGSHWRVASLHNTLVTVT